MCDWNEKHNNKKLLTQSLWGLKMWNMICNQSFSGCLSRLWGGHARGDRFRFLSLDIHFRSYHTKHNKILIYAPVSNLKKKINFYFLNRFSWLNRLASIFFYKNTNIFHVLDQMNSFDGPVNIFRKKMF